MSCWKVVETKQMHVVVFVALVRIYINKTSKNIFNSIHNGTETQRNVSARETRCDSKYFHRVKERVSTQGMSSVALIQCV